MSKIEFENDGSTYTLEFDRRSAEIAERSLGVSLTEILNGKVTYFPALFHASFLKHHPKIKPGKVKRLFEAMENKDKLFEALTGMYAETVSTLMDDPEEGKAQSWKVL